MFFCANSLATDRTSLAYFSFSKKVIAITPENMTKLEIRQKESIRMLIKL